MAVTPGDLAGSDEATADAALEGMAGEDGGSESTEGAETTGAEDTGLAEFFNPADLPPELLPVYKRMQGAYTQKTQAVAQKDREVEEKKAEIEAESSTVEAVQRLVNTPEWGVFRQMFENGELSGDGASRTSSNGSDESDLDATEEGSSSVTQAVRAVERKYEGIISDMGNKLAKIEAKQFADSKPDFGKYKKQIVNILRTRGGTLDDAYRTAKAPDLERENATLQARLAKLEGKKTEDASVEIPSAPRLTPKKVKAKSWAEAQAMCSRCLREAR